VIELHISNVHKREEFRHHSVHLPCRPRDHRRLRRARATRWRSTVSTCSRSREADPMDWPRPDRRRGRGADRANGTSRRSTRAGRRSSRRSSTRSRPPRRWPTRSEFRCTGHWPSCSRRTSRTASSSPPPNQLHVDGGPGVRRGGCPGHRGEADRRHGRGCDPPGRGGGGGGSAAAHRSSPQLQRDHGQGAGGRAERRARVDRRRRGHGDVLQARRLLRRRRGVAHGSRAAARSCSTSSTR
jgi:hypothetical protein